MTPQTNKQELLTLLNNFVPDEDMPTVEAAIDAYCEEMERQARIRGLYDLEDLAKPTPRPKQNTLEDLILGETDSPAATRGVPPTAGLSAARLREAAQTLKLNGALSYQDYEPDIGATDPKQNTSNEP